MLTFVMKVKNQWIFDSFLDYWLKWVIFWWPTQNNTRKINVDRKSVTVPVDEWKHIHKNIMDL